MSDKRGRSESRSDTSSVSSSRTSSSDLGPGGGVRLNNHNLGSRFSSLAIEPSETTRSDMHARTRSLSQDGCRGDEGNRGRKAYGVTQDNRGTASQGSPQFQVGNVPSNGDDSDVFSGKAGSGPAKSPIESSAAFQGQLPPFVTAHTGMPGQPAAAASYVPVYGTGYNGGSGYQGAGYQGSGYNGDSYQGGGYSRGRDSGHRRDRVGDVDAQAYYPATACVFVANLPEGIKDGRLECEVTRAFSEFGTVFVKIRRDAKNMPFAFCQFTKDEEAQVARVRGKGIMIEGRPCRTEMVKANRDFIIYNAQGFEIGIEEARYQLASYGPMAKCEKVHPQIVEALKLHSAILVQFTTFDPSRDVVSSFRNNPQYRVMAYDLRKVTQANKPDADEEWLKRYEADRRSIFVGNLPPQMDNLDDALRSIFHHVGDIVDVNVIQRESRSGGNRINAFAFVEFARPDLAERAIESMNNFTLGGCQIRVERKSSRDRQGPRTMRSQAALGGSNRARSDDERIPATPLRREHYHPSAQASGPVGPGAHPMSGYVPAYANFPATPGTPGIMGAYYAGYPTQAMYHPGAPIMSPYLASPPMAHQNMACNHGLQQSPESGTSASYAAGQTGTPTRSASRDEETTSYVKSEDTNGGAGSSKSA